MRDIEANFSSWIDQSNEDYYENNFNGGFGFGELADASARDIV
tara:strand:+ start:496 stop:624 length:129 start_codon:yes stop_codon:yes gene_type:complete